MHFLALFHTASTLSGSLRSPPSPRGEGFVRRYCFSTYACIHSDDRGIAVFSYRCLPHLGRGTASAVDRVLSFIVDLRRISSLSFIPLVPYPARSARHLPLEGKALFGDSGILVSQPSPLGNAVKLSKILIAHASNSVCFFHPLSLLVNNKIKKLVK